MGKQKRPKKPVIAEPVETRKNPVIAERLTANENTPTWRIFHLEMCDPFGWHILERAKLEEILGKLRDFERLTWNEILVRNKERNHSVPVIKLCKGARDRLQELKLDDVDELVSLRLSGAERVWGIRYSAVLSLLWWDPNHNVCPSLKKHT